MNRLKQILLPLLALPALVSCDNDTFPAYNGQEQPVTLAVSLDKGAMSRASIGTDALDKENFIINGDYSIFLGIKDPEVLGFPHVHCCRFTNDRKGLIYPVTPSTKEVSASPLTWSDAKVDKKDFEFILDNIGYQEACSWNPDTEFLGKAWDNTEKNTTYAAQKEEYDANKKPQHTNDIIWGRDIAKYDESGKSSVVELTHRMTRINVVFVNLDQTLTKEERKGMTVSIENLVLDAESFNRYDGTVAIADNPNRGILKLKGEGEDLPLLGNGIDEENNTYKEYGTANFILPPQPLVEVNWPKVVVRYQKGGQEVTKSGLIPHEILYESSDASRSSSWVKLDQLHAGNHLTIVVEIKEGIPEIIFTAKVKEWKELGPVTVTAGQRKPGINNTDELEEAIRLYNSLPVFASTTDLTPLPVYPDKEHPEYPNRINAIDDRLLLYGTPAIVENALQWTFPINFELNGYVPNPGFRNIMWATAENSGLRGYSYPLNLTSEKNKEEKLATLKGAKGIYNIEDLNAMISTVIKDIAGTAPLYGELNSKTATYTFNLRADISGEVLRKLPKTVTVYGTVYTMTYVMNDNGFFVNGSKDVNTLIEQ